MIRVVVVGGQQHHHHYPRRLMVSLVLGLDMHHVDTFRSLSYTIIDNNNINLRYH